MKPGTKKWVKFCIRWGIAIGGIWYVLAHINLHDRVMVLDADSGTPAYLRVLDEPGEDERVYRVVMADGTVESIDRDQVWTSPDRKKVALSGHRESARVLAMRPREPGRAGIAPEALLVRIAGQQRPMVI